MGIYYLADSKNQQIMGCCTSKDTYEPDLNTYQYNNDDETLTRRTPLRKYKSKENIVSDSPLQTKSVFIPSNGPESGISGIDF